MELSVITYEQAKVLKELGFESEEYSYIYLNGVLYTREEYNEMDCGGPFSAELAEEETLYAYSQDIILKWLREEKNIQIIITTRDEDWWYFQLLLNWNFDNYHTGYERTTYEEAVDDAIDEAIKILNTPN